MLSELFFALQKTPVSFDQIVTKETSMLISLADTFFFKKLAALSSSLFFPLWSLVCFCDNYKDANSSFNLETDHKSFRLQLFKQRRT